MRKYNNLMHSPMIGTAMVSAMCSSSLMAQTVPVEQAKSDSSGQIEDIIVTAERRSASANTVPLSITALSADTLADRGITDPADLVRVVPGFNYTRSAYGAPVYTIRGIGFYDTAIGATPAVSVYLDEAPIPFSIMTSGTAFDLERVEVLKGPQGLLYGQNSTGGAINYISAKPTNDMAAGINASYGRFNEVDATAFVSGPLSQTVRARAAIRYNRADDWQRSYSRDASIGKTDFIAGRFILDWEPSEGTLVRFNVNGWRDKSDNQAGQLFQIIPSARLPAIIRNYPLAPSNSIRAADFGPGNNFDRDDSFWQASGRIELRLSESMKLTSITTYQEFKRDSLVDVDGTIYFNYNINQAGSIKSVSQELRLDSEISNDIQWLIGANYAHDKVFEDVDVSADSPAFSSFAVRGAKAIGDTKLETVAIFGNVNWKVLSDLTLQAGARYTRNKQDFFSCTYDNGDGTVAAAFGRAATVLSGRPVVIAPGACATLSPTFSPGPFRDRLTEDNLSWRLGLSYQANPSTLLYANVARGYKSGSFPVVGSTFSLGLAPATQESVLSYEAGFKVGLANRALQINGALFHSRYSDKQVKGALIDAIVGRVNRLINIPSAKVSGAELEVTWIPVSGLTIVGAGTYVKSRIGAYLGNDGLGAFKQLEGESFPLTPKWQLRASANYEAPVTETLNILAGVDYSFQGRTNSALGSLPQLANPSYSLVDARLGVRSPQSNWSAALFVRNLTNEKYWNFASAAGVPDTLTRFVGKPRTYGVRFTVEY